MPPLGEAGRAVPATALRDLEDAVALHQAGRFGEALVRYRRVLAAEPDNVDALNLGGVALVQTGAADEALGLLARAAATAPGRADVHYNLGRALADLRRFGAAAGAFRRAVEAAPNDAQAHNNLGLALAELGQAVEAETALRRALALRAEYAEAHNNLGALLLDDGRLDEALVEIQRALDVAPDYAGACNNLGAVLRDSGKIEEAAGAFRRALAIDPDSAEAYGNLYGLKTLAPSDADIVAMQSLLAGPAVTERRAVVLSFALASAFESLGRYDEAFEHLARGNRLKRASIEYDGDAREAKTQGTIAAFGPDMLSRSAGRGCPSRAPIFVVGMPRSGTTLVEQILASHSQVYGGGELRDLPALVDRLENRLGSRRGYPDMVPDLAADELCRLGETYVAALGKKTG